MPFDKLDDKFPIEHLEARIKVTQQNILTHQQSLASIRAIQQKYVKYPKIYNSFFDEIDHTKAAIVILEKELKYSQDKLAQMQK